MPDKHLATRLRLREYLQRKGVAYDSARKTWRCPNHADDHPSAVLYENPDGGVLYCPVCNQSWGIFDVAGIIDGVNAFKDKVKSVNATLGIAEEKPKPRSKTPLPFPAGREGEFNEKIKSIATEKGWGRIAGSWKYHDRDGKVIALDVRFEAEGQKKTVLTFWYDGALKWSGAPVLVYNLHEIVNTQKPVLLGEGAKKGEAGKALQHFTSSGWSGGAAKAGLADWSALANRETYIFPDDDDPGMKAAHTIRQHLPHAHIIKPIPAARELKPKGADIVEALQVMMPDELTAYILNPENHISDVAPSDPPSGATHERPPTSPPPDGATSEMPFKVLGIGDDGRAYFITEAGRIVDCNLDGLSKSKLMVLTGRWFWREHYAQDGKIVWDSAIDDIIRLSQNRDHNESRVRGRGAWRDGELISYHDGVNTYGEHAPGVTYIRLSHKDIGINDEPATSDTVKQIRDTVFRLSFETPADAVRCLGWATLAPFAGALKFRPAMLLTGPSGSGKSTVANQLMRKLSNCEWMDGSGTTVAGVRGKIQRDSCAVIFEETERDTEKKKINRNELFSLMRVNVTDDAPDTVKGTKDGGFHSFKMQNMFGFIAIDPTVDSIADENRVFRINMVPPQNQGEWKQIESALSALLTDTNCRALRALTWRKLKTIFALSDRIVDAIREKTGRDYRSSYSDAMLASAFMVVWSSTDSPTDAQIESMLNKYYAFQPAEEHRDEAAEVVDRLLDEVIEVMHENSREKLTIMECLTRAVMRVYDADGQRIEVGPPRAAAYKQHVARYGLKIVDGDGLAIVNKHHQIQRITGLGDGYQRLLKRHRAWAEGSRQVMFPDGKNRRCTVLRGILADKIVLTDDERLEALM
jgi:adenosyl cobinamide kinase/adenosyl cobinamide phosphate guanylyltransferase